MGYYRRAIDLGNTNSTIVYQVVRWLSRTGQLTEADSLVRKMQDQQSGLSLEMGRLASRINYAREDYDRALELAEGLPQESDSIDDAWWVGYLQLLNKEYDAAEKSFQKCDQIASRKCRMAGSLWCAVCINRAKLPEEAKKEKQLQAEAKMQEAMAKIKPELQPFAKAECLKILGRPDEAKATYRDAIKATPDSVPVLRPAADFFLTSADTRPEARAILQRFVGGELEADAATMQWARRSLAQLISCSNFAERSRALEMIKANLAEIPTSVPDLQLQARLLSFSPSAGRPSERHSASFGSWTTTGSRWTPKTAICWPDSVMADGDWSSYNDQMLKLLSSPIDPLRRNGLYQRVHQRAAATQNSLDSREAQRWADRLQADSPNDITSAIRSWPRSRPPARVLGPMWHSRPCRRPSKIPTFCLPNKTEKMEYAVAGLWQSLNS